jgi:hypothetical protein
MKNIIWLSPSLAAGTIAARLVAFFKRRPQTSRRRGNLRPPPAPPGEEINAGLKGGVAALGIAGAMATTVMPAVPAHATIATVGDPDDYSGYSYTVELSLVALSETPPQAAYMAHTICLDRERVSARTLSSPTVRPTTR